MTTVGPLDENLQFKSTTSSFKADMTTEEIAKNFMDSTVTPSIDPGLNAQNVTMSIVQNLSSISSSPTSYDDVAMSDTPFQNYSEHHALQENGTESYQYSVPVPGNSEIMIIIAIVFVLLYIAAKYIGCTLSHWPIVSKCFKHRGSDHYSTSGNSGGHHLGNRYRQEYSRRDVHYAVYTRPGTAFPRPLSAYPGSGGMSAGFQDPGFSYNSSFNMNDVDHCKVVVNGDSEDAEQPPTYDSIVPSYTTTNRYTYSSTR